MNILIDREEATPLCRQIVRQAREMILTTQLSPGFRLPRERRLAALLGVSRTTVTNAR
jgi:DNA-binding FadR family transcriptional regulator